MKTMTPRIVDDRFTPIMADYHAREVYELLDFNTRTVFRDIQGPNSTNVMLDSYPEYKPGEESGAEVTIMFSCTSDNPVDVCEMDMWEQPTHWIWLKSDVCSSYHNRGGKQFVHDKFCENKIYQHVLHYNSSLGVSFREMESEEIDDEWRQIFVAMDEELIPGVMNQATLQQIKMDLSGEMYLGEGEPFDPIVMTMIGESVAERIGMFWVSKQNTIDSLILKELPLIL